MSQDHPQLSYLPTAIQSLHIAPRLVPKLSPNATTHDTNATPPAYAGEGCIIVAHIASVGLLWRRSAALLGGSQID